MRGAMVALPILLSLIIIAQPPISAPTPVAMSLEGPLAMTPGQVGIFFVNISGGPVEINATYTLRYWIESSDTTGGSPLQGGPGEVSSRNTTFQVNITAISREGSMDVVVEGVAGNDTVNTTVRKTLTVQVLAPLILTASFANDGGAAAMNVTVRFYVDDRFVGQKIVGRINPSDRGTASYTWIPVGASFGQHAIRVEADIDGNGIIDPTKGETVAYDIFYKTGGDIPAGYLVILSVAISVLGILALFAYRRRLKTR